VPLRLGLALLIANYLVRESMHVRLLRGALFLPSVTSTVSIAVVFSWVFSTDYGMVNAILFRAIEKNTLTVGELSVNCDEAAVNPEIDALQQHHDARGLPLVTERFRTERVVIGDGGTVAFAQTGTEVTADAGTPILDAAEEAGVLMPSGCRMGICFGCVLPLRSGSVRDLRNGEITTATEGETANGGIRIQTCISAAAGACEIDH
jgi:ferredoxin